MLQYYFSLRPFRLIKWSFFIHSSTPTIHPRLDFSSGAEVFRLQLHGWIQKIQLRGPNNVFFMSFFLFLSQERIYRGPNDPPSRSNWTPWSVPIFIRKHIAACDFPGGGPEPLYPPPPPHTHTMNLSMNDVECCLLINQRGQHISGQ